MRMAGRLAMACAAGLLAVLAIPFALVQFDVWPASWLRGVPAAMAVVIAATFVVGVLRLGRRGDAGSGKP